MEKQNTQYVIRCGDKFLTAYSGFTAKDIRHATKYSEKDASKVAENLSIALPGVICVKVISDENIIQNQDGTSFGICYIRKNDIDPNDFSVKSNRLNPSERRFRTYDEAKHHAQRFVEIMNHCGYYIFISNTPVNSYVNVITGKTNPDMGASDGTVAFYTT